LGLAAMLQENVSDWPTLPMHAMTIEIPRHTQKGIRGKNPTVREILDAVTFDKYPP
jgi:hypothetical protein